MARINWYKIIDGIAAAMMMLTIVVLTAATLALLLFDTIVGTGSNYKLMEYLSGNNRTIAAIFGSVSSTGLQTALAFMAYLAFKRNVGVLGWIFFVAGLAFWGVDVYFDALTADIVRYGNFIALDSLVGIERDTHFMWRTAFGGFSVIGEFFALAILAGMSELKAFIRSTLNNFEKYTPPQQPKKQQPYQSSHNAGTNRQTEQEKIARLNASRAQASANQPVQKPAHADEMAQEFNEFMDSVAEEPTYHPQNYRA